MPSFATVTAYGHVNKFDHPCFAWVGRQDRDKWVAIRFYKPYKTQDDHYEAFYDALMKSSLRHEEGFNATKHDSFIEVDMTKLRELPFWRVLRILKFGFKVFTYTLQVSERLTTALLKGSNFQEASFIAGDTYGYHYPNPAYKVGEEQQLFEFLAGGPMVDLTKWHNAPESNKYTPYKKSLKPFKEVGGGAATGAYGACHPLTMDWDGFIFSSSALDAGKYSAEELNKGLERIKRGVKNA